MRRTIPAVLASLLLLSPLIAAEKIDSAALVIERYQQMTIPPGNPFGKDRDDRLQILQQLKQTPDQSVSAIAAALPNLNDPLQRAELAEALRWFPNPQSAALLAKLLNDPDQKVRGNAIHALRMMARRVDRSGGSRTQRSGPFPPKVDGLVPHLIAAASDKTDVNRVVAAYALADTLDPAAVPQLRKLLDDEAWTVRFHAACLLTEFADASGLMVLRNALTHLLDPANQETSGSLHTEMLLNSMQRITGKSFGPIPMDPGLMSDTRQAAAATKQHQFLMQTWAQWWAWEPQPR